MKGRARLRIPGYDEGLGHVNLCSESLNMRFQTINMFWADRLAPPKLRQRRHMLWV
jgi:hypothetical protein